MIMVKIMNKIFEKQMKDILKDEYDDFMVSLTQPNIKAFYLNPQKKNVLNYLNQEYIKPHVVVKNGYYFDYEHYPLGKSPFLLVEHIISKNQVQCLFLIF